MDVVQHALLAVYPGRLGSGEWSDLVISRSSANVVELQLILILREADSIKVSDSIAESDSPNFVFMMEKVFFAKRVPIESVFFLFPVPDLLHLGFLCKFLEGASRRISCEMLFSLCELLCKTSIPSNIPCFL